MSFDRSGVRCARAAVAAICAAGLLVRLGRHIFVAWQNGVGPMGEPGPHGATSTVTE
jgi:hypothetical protein